MQARPRLGKSDSKRTLNSLCMENDVLNESVDMDSEDMS